MGRKGMPETPEQWEKWEKDRVYAEERVEHLEEELDKALEDQEKLEEEAEKLRQDRDEQKRQRGVAELDAKAARASADQATAAAAAASRSLKGGDKLMQLRAEVQHLKARNHGLSAEVSQLKENNVHLEDSRALIKKDNEKLVVGVKELETALNKVERDKEDVTKQLESKVAEIRQITTEKERAQEEANRLDAQNQRLGDELDRLADEMSNSGVASNSKDLTLERKERGKAEERALAVEKELALCRRELSEAKEDLEKMEDLSEMKASASREGLLCADKKLEEVKAEAAELREELSALRESERVVSAKGEGLVSQVEEAGAARKKLEEMVASMESELAQSKGQTRMLESRLKQQAVMRGKGSDEEGGIMEVMKLLKVSEASNEELQEKLSATEMKLRVREADNKNKVNGVHSGMNGTSRELFGQTNHTLREREREREGKGKEGSARVAELEREVKDARADLEKAEDNAQSVENEMKDLHMMLDNVIAERDVALNDLRRSGDAGVGGSSGGGEEAESEIRLLRGQVEELRRKLSATERMQQHVGNGDTSRVKIKNLEEQLERFTRESTQKSETWRGLSDQFESEKLELSQDLIKAKLQVAQLSMDIDRLKLQFRQAPGTELTLKRNHRSQRSYISL